MRVWLLVLLLAGCAQPHADPVEDDADPLAALGLVHAQAPFSLDGSTLCLPGEGGDDVTCDVPGGSRILLGPYDAVIIGVNVTVRWTPERPTTEELVLRLHCNLSGASADPAPCDEMADHEVRGHSPLAIGLEGLQTPPSAVLEVRVFEPDLAPGQPSYARQSFHVEGTVDYAPEPDATNQG